MTIAIPEIPLQVITPDDVRESIRQTMWHLGNAMARVAWQVEMETWVTLGYKSWDEMREAEYGGIAVIVPKEDRLDFVGRLHAAGLTQRSIAATIGVDERTIRRDLTTGQMSGSDDVIDAEIVEPEPIKPRRRPDFAKSYGNAMHELARAIHRMETLHEDDRFRKHRAELYEWNHRPLDRFEAALVRLNIEIAGGEA
ncbi:hypothetical protein [Microlunatus sp. Y2014]|uniref:hypothetical protein n=1 Tax=Microlunatus sp. Y2014 TaxID=3418488 RepID=UPI003DA74AA0